MKERSRPMPGSDCGKKTCGKTSAAAEPKRKKSYHSMLVPANVESTTRRREEGGGLARFSVPGGSLSDGGGVVAVSPALDLPPKFQTGPFWGGLQFVGA